MHNSIDVSVKIKDRSIAIAGLSAFNSLFGQVQISRMENKQYAYKFWKILWS